MLTGTLMLVGMLMASPAQAQFKLAVVDFNRASQEVTEGAQIQTELMELQRSRQVRMDDMEKQILGMREEFEKQAMILSEDTRRQKEQEIIAATQQYQQAVMAAQQEMQQAYEKKAGGLFQRLRTVAEKIGAEKAYDLILESSQGGVVYTGNAEDVTDELIKRFNAGG
jgi:outer membrane protein